MSDELPPSSNESEMGVLGCLLLDSVEVLPEIAHIPSEAFYDIRHREVFKHALQLSKDGKPIDSSTVHTALSESKIDVGGIGYLHSLEAAAPTRWNLSYHLPLLLEKHLRRRILKGCEIISGQAKNGSGIDAVLETIQKLMALEKHGVAPIQDGRQSSDRMIADLSRRHELRGELSGLDTGFTRINNMTCGLQYGEQTLIGARPSQGKTAMGLNIFQTTVFTNNIPALFITLEMSTEALMRRLLASWASIGLFDVRKGTYTEKYFAMFKSFQMASRKAPMFIIDGVSGMTISEICTQVKKYVARHKIRLVIVDYLQKIKASSRHEKRTYEIGEVSERLKALAVETGTAFLTLAQLNREGERDKGRPPRMSDLADSGQIERDADTILLLHRKREDTNGEAKVIIAKQRDGLTGIIDLHFNGEYCRFENELPSNHESYADR